jgi:uncharacterized surface anchored protein
MSIENPQSFEDFKLIDMEEKAAREFSEAAKNRLVQKPKSSRAGAIFTIQHIEGGQIGYVETDEDGDFVIEDIREGTYIVKQSTAPDGFTIDPRARIVTIKPGVTKEVEFQMTQEQNLLQSKR